MSQQQIESCLDRALDELFVADYHLLDVDSSERSISHRLAVHLIREFPNYDVDCEYNRDGFDVKRLQLSERNTSDDSADAVTVFPDIVIHRRGTNKHNLLVIEVKKGSSNISHDYDIKKLTAFRQELSYMFAAHVIVGKQGSDKVIRKVVWIN